MLWCSVFPDGPHILQPVDLAFGDPLESLDDTGAASTDPEAAFRAWGFKPTPDDPEPGLVEALEVIKDALSKDTYAVSAQDLVHSTHMWLTFASFSFLFFLWGVDRVYLGLAKGEAWLQPSLHW